MEERQTGRPTLIPSRDRGATYGRQAELNVPNPKGEPGINLCCRRSYLLIANKKGVRVSVFVWSVVWNTDLQVPLVLIRTQVLICAPTIAVHDDMWCGRSVAAIVEK